MSDAMDYSLFADLYDTYVRTDLDIPFFLNQAQQVQGDVLELMSGTGRVSLPLLEAGVKLTCLDSSPDMLERLKGKVGEKGLSAAIHWMDVRNFDLEKKFDLIFIPFHAFAELLSTADQLQTLERICVHLAPGGIFICTLHNPPVRLKRVDGQLRLWSSAPAPGNQGKLLVWGLETYDPPAESVHGMQFFEIYDARGLLQSKRKVEFTFRILQKAAFEKLVSAAGLQVIDLYGDYACSPFVEETSPVMIWKLAR